MMNVALLLSGLSLLLTSPALSHPGRTDASGCHTNRTTGVYHCHNGGSSGGGSSRPAPAPPRQAAPPAPPQPVCRDVPYSMTNITFYRTASDGTRTRWIRRDDVDMSTVDASLGGQPGILRRYVIEGIQVRQFLVAGSRHQRFSFDESAWLDAPAVTQNGNTQTTMFTSNPLLVHSQEEAVVVTTRRVCS